LILIKAEWATSLILFWSATGAIPPWGISITGGNIRVDAQFASMPWSESDPIQLLRTLIFIAASNAGA
jgi:hypothetical protein